MKKIMETDVLQKSLGSPALKTLKFRHEMIQYYGIRLFKPLMPLSTVLVILRPHKAGPEPLVSLPGSASITIRNFYY